MVSPVSIEDFVSLFGEDPMRLPDVIALNTSISDWPKVLTALNDHEWTHSVKIPGRLPADTLSSIPFKPVPGVLINLWPGNIVQFDFDLVEMRDQRTVDSVLEVARVIGSATSQLLVFVPEMGRPGEAVLTYDPILDDFRV